MLRLASIRSRLNLLSALFVVSLVITNVVLINQMRIQNDLIGQAARHIDVIVRADRAIQTFGDLKYWLTDLAVGACKVAPVAMAAPTSDVRTAGSNAETSRKTHALPSRLPSQMPGQGR